MCVSTGLRAIYRVSTRKNRLTTPLIPSRGAGMRDKIGPVHPLPHSTREKVRPAGGFQRPIREKVRPASPNTPILGCFQRAGRTFSRSRTPSGRAGRTFSRTGHSHVATMQPPSPLQPKYARKTPISHPQRRHRFQLKLDLRKQRRQGFQSHAGTSEQRRHHFQTTTPRAAISPLPRKLARNSIG